MNHASCVAAVLVTGLTLPAFAQGTPCGTAPLVEYTSGSREGGLLELQASGTPGAVQVLALGFNTSNWLGIPLPLPLSGPPFLFPSGCTLQVSVVESPFLAPDVDGVSSFTIPIPLGVAGASVYSQVLEFSGTMLPLAGIGTSGIAETEILPPPTISGVSTTSGGPGDSITIFGTNLDGSSSDLCVAIGSVLAVVESGDDNSITVELQSTGVAQSGPVSILAGQRKIEPPTDPTPVGAPPLPSMSVFSGNPIAANMATSSQVVSVSPDPFFVPFTATVLGGPSGFELKLPIKAGPNAKIRSGWLELRCDGTQYDFYAVDPMNGQTMDICFPDGWGPGSTMSTEAARQFFARLFRQAQRNVDGLFVTAQIVGEEICLTVTCPNATVLSGGLSFDSGDFRFCGDLDSNELTSDLFELPATAGEEITISLCRVGDQPDGSSLLDPRLCIYQNSIGPPQGATWVIENDDSGGDCFATGPFGAALIEDWVVPATDVYTIAASGWGGTQGPYVLIVDGADNDPTLVGDEVAGGCFF